MIRRHIVFPAALLGTVGLIATGCSGSSATPPAPPSSSPAVTSSSSPTLPPTTLPSTTPATPSAAPSTANTSGPPTNAAGVAECRNGDLHVTGQDGGTTDGHVARVLQFTDVSGHSCFLQGYPGAALLDASGTTLANAQRTLHGFLGSDLISATDPGLTAPPQVTLSPGHSALAELEWENNTASAGASGGCLIRQSPTLQITPPDSTEPTTLPGLTNVCAGFEIGPVLKDNASG